jgi:membrane fusion protein (multidrug efflux system)
MSRTRNALLIGGIAACGVLTFVVDHALSGGGVIERTNDAYIKADFSIVAPRIAGLIDHVMVDDNEQVHAGQELAHIDDRDFRAAVAATEADLKVAQADVANVTAALARQASIITQAQATVSADDAALTFARDNATRYQNLSHGGAGTVEQQQHASSQLEQAMAAKQRDAAAADAEQRQVAVLQAELGHADAHVLAAQAALEQARLNLSYTSIVAPVDGMVGQRSVRIGNHVSPGTPLLAVVPLNKAYVEANFQETQLAHVAPGQRVEITVDSFPGEHLVGTVDSLAPASGIAFSLIPPDNATGNFTKVVQRIPLKIVFNQNQPLLARLRVGMSVEAAVDTHISTTPNSAVALGAVP